MISIYTRRFRASASLRQAGFVPRDKRGLNTRRFRASASLRLYYGYSYRGAFAYTRRFRASASLRQRAAGRMDAVQVGYQTLSSVCFFEAGILPSYVAALMRYQTLSSVCFFEARGIRARWTTRSDTRRFRASASLRRAWAEPACCGLSRIPDAFERLLL